LTTPALA